MVMTKKWQQSNNDAATSNDSSTLLSFLSKYNNDNDYNDMDKKGLF